MRRPNILLILSDQEQHWDHLPPAMQRPGLERLRERGTSFANHHVVTVPCGPSRSTIYTGQHTRFTGVHSNPGRGRAAGMSTDISTVGHLLREHGYYTAYKGKWHVSVIDAPAPFSAATTHALEPYGFAEYTPDGDPVGVSWDGYRRDPAVASDAANWLLGLGGDKPTDAPWFLAVNFVNPHDVMFFDATARMNQTGTNAVPRLPAPRDPLYRTFWDADLPANFADRAANEPAAHEALRRFTTAALGEIPLEDHDAWRALRSYYFNCLRDLDRSVVTVLDALRESGHDDDTAVIYTTDHGEAGGAHGLREKPTSIYREVVNVPLVIAHPDVPGGGTTPALSSAIDLAPTVLALAGVTAAERADRHPQLRGSDLTGALTDPSGPRDETGVLFAMTRPALRLADDGPYRSHMRGCFDGRWKFARYFRASDEESAGRPERLRADNDLELYDTVKDPAEIRNLATDPTYADQVARCAVLLAHLEAAELGAMDTPSSICNSDAMQIEDGLLARHPGAASAGGPL